MGGITRTPPPVVSPPPSSAAGPSSILILLLLSSLLLPLASPSSSQEEVEALKALKSTFNDPSNNTQGWDFGLVSACTWPRYIACDNGDDHVTQINMESAVSGGTLVPDLGNLEELNHLDLKGNGLSGEIPKELGNLKKLVTLNLSQNNLTGSIPIELCNIATLRNLWLDDNKLTGEVPAECFRKQNFVFNGNTGLIGVPATPSLPTDSAGPNSTPPKRLMGWMVVITTISLVSPWVVKRRHETDC